MVKAGATERGSVAHATLALAAAISIPTNN